MQTSASKTIQPKSSANVSKRLVTGGSSRIRNTSGGDSSAVGGGSRTRVIIDGKHDATPRNLVPAQYMQVQGTGLGSVPENGQARPVFEGGEEKGDEQQATQPPERVKPVRPAGLSKEELECQIDIILAETETETLLSFPSLCVALDNPSSASVTARNKAYDELCSSKADSDQYRDQHAQTLNNPHKAKEVWAPPPSQESVEVSANGWDIYDTFATDPVPKHEQIQMACEKEAAAYVAQAIKKPGCLFTMNEPYPSHEPGKDGSGNKDKKKRDGKNLSGKLGLSGGVTSGSTGGAGGKSGTLGAGQSGLALTSTAMGGAGTAPAAPDAESAAAIKDGAADGAAHVGEDGAVAIDAKAEEEALPEIMPWQTGGETPIPEDLTQAVKVMERIVSQNVFHKQHMIYRNYPTLEELARLDELRAEEARVADAALHGGGSLEGKGVGVGAMAHGVEPGESEEVDEAETECQEESDKPSLQDLFCFDAPQLTQGTTVTCAEWNRHNQDLLAVSYGDTTPVPTTQGGLVLFWSLKNPTYPERVLRTRHGVTALHFSSVHPNMVAAGSHDGSVMIWDLRRESDQPVLHSGSSTSQQNDQKHTDIVWETRWVDQGPDKQPPELLVSVSSDGNVLQWSMKKGLEQQLLMPLKRLPNKQLGSNSVYGHKEGIVFRKSSGFCIDFPRHDPSTYMVGTEDGLVHRCSTSYNEQYLETYYGHSGPVYRVRCNPFASHAFLTCSADWTIRLWTTKPVPGHQPDSPLLTFQSTDLNDAVNDVIWAPQNSTSFAAAMDDGRVELWDLSEKPLDPIVVHYPMGQENVRRRTCVRFSPNSPVLVAGDDKGCVVVMRMYNTNQSYYSDQEQQERLNAVMVKRR